MADDEYFGARFPRKGEKFSGAWNKLCLLHHWAIDTGLQFLPFGLTVQFAAQAIPDLALCVRCNSIQPALFRGGCEKQVVVAGNGIVEIDTDF